MQEQLQLQLKQLPTDPGIYKYFDKHHELIYVGKAVNLKNRVRSYFTDSKQHSPKTRVLVSQIDHLETIVVRSELDALILEANLIKQHKPRYNIILKDDKSHLYIKITLYEDLPRLSTCRATDLSLDPKATYFGPYPSGGTARQTLRYLRRVFPYVAHHQPPLAGRRRPPQSYFYFNLPLGETDKVIDQQRYRKQMFQLIRFLEGKRAVVADELEKDMKLAAKTLDFERAGEIKKQLDGIAYVTQFSITPETYLSNPELMADKREMGLRELATALSPYFQIDTPDTTLPLHRIECYDISNIGGKQAVGSMVALVDGEPSKRDYRKFKIKGEQTPNDVAMIEEVLRRRLKRIASTKQEGTDPDTSFSALPDLIIIDGGKGQITAAMQVLHELGLSIPLVGMTKREEELVIYRPGESAFKQRPSNNGHEEAISLLGNAPKPNRSSAHAAFAKNETEAETQVFQDAHFTTVRLARGSESLFLIQRLRDEAHRFAITYHRKLRQKSFLPTQSK